MQNWSMIETILSGLCAKRTEIYFCKTHPYTCRTISITLRLNRRIVSVPITTQNMRLQLTKTCSQTLFMVTLFQQLNECLKWVNVNIVSLQPPLIIGLALPNGKENHLINGWTNIKLTAVLIKFVPPTSRMEAHTLCSTCANVLTVLLKTAILLARNYIFKKAEMVMQSSKQSSIQMALQRASLLKLKN